ncbi:MAG: hypothetical protein J6Q47_00945 [Paludibacteraceae bacterium]|nr:hypothetical protein [Opitutales bacterium]MBO5849833.1 hypothetical protein [Paludibacteraceae bacterium]
MTIEKTIHISFGKRRNNQIRNGHPKSKINRASELMAIAIVFDEWLESGKVESYTELAQITGLSNPEISRIMDYRLKPVNKQEILLSIA